MLYATKSSPEISPDPPFTTPKALHRCVRCGDYVFQGEVCYTLYEGLFCGDCALDYLRDNKRLAGDSL